jgi:isocitrate dehydrogenase (NAD+)
MRDDSRTTFVPKPGDSSLRKVTLFPGDGIGPEVCNAVVEVFKAARVPVQWDRFERKNPNKLPEGLIESLRKNCVGLKGTFQTNIDDHHHSLNNTLRKELKLYADVVSCFNIPGVKTRHDNVNVTLIRENTEGEYSGLEHEVVPGVVESLKIVSAEASTRIAEYAFEYAFINNRRKVTAVNKANIQKLADGLFLQCCRTVAKKYPQIQFQEILIDNCCEKIISNPSMFDVLVMPNLYGTILSNVCCGLVGGPGMTGGANVGDNIAVFEQGARHVGADIAGKDIANPTGTLLASILMLRHLSLPSFADRLERALFSVHKEKLAVTHDLGGKATTSDFVRAVIAKL